MELSGFEMILIFLIALVVLGPEEMIKHAVTVGRFVGKMRTQFNNFKVMTQEELLKRADISEMKELEEIKEKVQGLSVEFDSHARETEHALHSVISPKTAAVDEAVPAAPGEIESQVESQLANLAAKNKGDA